MFFKHIGWLFPGFSQAIGVLSSSAQTQQQRGVTILFFFFLILFIWLCQVLVLACEIFCCGTWHLVLHPGIEPKPPALGAWSVTPWTTREVPHHSFFTEKSLYYVLWAIWMLSSYPVASFPQEVIFEHAPSRSTIPWAYLIINLTQLDCELLEGKNCFLIALVLTMVCCMQEVFETAT